MEGKTISHSYKELIVWQKAQRLAVCLYNATQFFPNEERYALTAQMRRAVVSIPSNIAEGRSRGSRKDYAQFLRIAYASAAELESQIALAKELPNVPPAIDWQQVDSLLLEVMKMLNALIAKLNPRSPLST